MTVPYPLSDPEFAPAVAALTDFAAKTRFEDLPGPMVERLGLVVADGDYVIIHGRYIGWGSKPLVAVDIFRVANGKIAEHWDVMQEEVPAAQSANGNSMLTTQA